MAPHMTTIINRGSIEVIVEFRCTARPSIASKPFEKAALANFVDLSPGCDAGPWDLAVQFGRKCLDELAPVGIFKRHFAFRLGPHPYRCCAHRVRLEAWEDVPVDVRFEIAETFVIELERRCSKRDRAADRHRLIEKSARMGGRQKMNLVDVASCEHHAIAT